MWPWGSVTLTTTPLYPQTLALTSLTSDGRSLGIVHSLTEPTEFVCFFLFLNQWQWNLFGRRGINREGGKKLNFSKIMKYNRLPDRSAISSTASNHPRIYVLSCTRTVHKLNSVVWVRERTIPTEWPPLVGEVIANFLRIEGATWSAWRIPTAIFSVF
jgi:hypothetical protein